MNEAESGLYEQVVELTRQLVRQRLQLREFRPGLDSVPYAGRVYDEEEVAAGVRSMLDFWLTLGPEGAAFERELASYLGLRKSILVNSGSSANLVALAALTSPQLGPRRLRPGDEVITVAAGFPTTVAPIIQCGATAVFVDNDPATGNVNTAQLEAAVVPGKTKAVILAHTLGNPFDLETVVELCRRHGLWLIEDNCDALGSRYGGQLTGSFGDLSTQSFYPPHHLTMGEGGAVGIKQESRLQLLVESFRDWGRDCWCSCGKDNTCGKRFQQQFGELPAGYDHKYVYSHLGYNLKPLDPQAAIGRAQLKKLPGFIEARRKHWDFLRAALEPMAEFFDFMLPTHATGWDHGRFRWESGRPVVEPSWFGFLLLLKDTAPFSRQQLVEELDRRKIGSRMLFGGNLVRQPALVALRRQFELGEARNGHPPFRVAGSLEGADRIMNRGLFIGVYPGLKQDMLDYMADVFREFCGRYGRLAA